MTAPLPINRASLHGEVTSRLRELIVIGEIRPGSRINERLLCEQLQISRTPLREALKFLAAEGLVELLPNRGAIATRLSADEVMHVFEVMAALEGLSGELACNRMTREQLIEIKALHFEMLAHYQRRDRTAYLRCNQAIHDQIIIAARNPTLHSTYIVLNTRVRRARLFANLPEERWGRAVAEHNVILETLEQRDAKRLRQLLEQHRNGKRDSVLEALDAEELPPLETLET